MNTLLSKSSLSTAIALTLVACAGDSGGLAGIGGSGFISSGSVTAFGSVFVNGVEFETGNTVFDIDDSGSGSQDDLAIGMVVTVNGTVNADGITGTATSISFDDQLQGPVSNLSAPDADGDNRTFTVLGTLVHISAIDTTFDVTGILGNTAFSFDLIANANNVEISGFFNTDGELVATRVELKAATFSTGDVVELKGTISGFTDISSPFTLAGLNNISINATAAVLDDLPNGLSNAAAVEVKGTCTDTSCSVLNASRVEGQNGFADADKISVEGLITDWVSSSNFKVNGISINASSAILSPAVLVLNNGVRVEVEGPISNNVINALTVELRGGSAKVHATVSSVDATTGDFVVTINAQPITVTVTSSTEMKDTVTVGNFVRVRGFENSSSGMTANRVEVRQDDDVIVQGKLQSIDKDVTISVLGVSFQIDDTPANNAETEFEDAADMEITQDQFIAAAPAGTLVKVKDKNGGSQVLNGVADEIEIELP